VRVSKCLSDEVSCHVSSDYRCLPSLPPSSPASPIQRNTSHCQDRTSMISPDSRETSAATTPALSSVDQVNSEMYVRDVLSETSRKLALPQPPESDSSYIAVDLHDDVASLMTCSSASLEPAQIRSQYEPLYLKMRDDTHSPSEYGYYVDNPVKFIYNT